MKKSILIFAIILIFHSCVKDKFELDRWDREINYNGEFAVPLFYGDLSFMQVLDLIGDNEYVSSNSENFISLYYRNSIVSDNIYKYLNFPEFTYEKLIPAADFQLEGNSYVVNETYNVSFGTNKTDAEITAALLDKGKIDIEINSTITYNAEIKLIFPSIIKNGDPLTLSLDLVQPGYNYLGNPDLSGYEIDFTTTPSKYNEIPINIKTIVSGTSEITAGQIECKINISDIEYSYVKGYLGQHVMVYEENNIKIPIFEGNKINIERFAFKEPKFNISYENYFGIPTMFYFEELVANCLTDGQDHNMLDIDGIPKISAPHYMAFPTVMGNYTKDSLKISNNGIAELISNKPSEIRFKAEIETNPNEKRHDNFISKDSKIKADILVELPLWGYVHNFYAIDTFNVDLSSIFNEKNPFGKAEVRIEVSNGFPLDLSGQIFFADENYQILDVIIGSDDENEQIFPAATVDSEGKTIAENKKILKINYSKERFDKIKNTKYAICKVYANTSNSDKNTLVKIYKDYKISFNVGAEVKFDIKEPIDSVKF